MPNWEKIKKNIGNLADKTVNKTKELTDTASLKNKDRKQRVRPGHSLQKIRQISLC